MGKRSKLGRASTPEIKIQSTKTMLPEQTKRYISSICQKFVPWFNLDDVHKAEERAMPEWFVKKKRTSKTRENYMEYRNWVINSYFHNPDKFLTATHCRQNLAADACSTVRLHSFLNYLQLINPGMAQTL